MNGSLKDNPCKCKPPKRTPTCKFDGTCTKYQEWAEARDKNRKLKADSERADKLYNDTRRDRIEMMRRRHGK